MGGSKSHFDSQSLISSFNGKKRICVTVLVNDVSVQLIILNLIPSLKVDEATFESFRVSIMTLNQSIPLGLYL